LHALEGPFNAGAIPRGAWQKYSAFMAKPLSVMKKKKFLCKAPATEVLEFFHCQTLGCNRKLVFNLGLSAMFSPKAWARVLFLP
jgi:hypothetical protein